MTSQLMHRRPRLLDLTAEQLALTDDLEQAYEQDPPDQAALARIAAEFEHNESLVIAKMEAYLALDKTFSMYEREHERRAAELRELSKLAGRNKERLRARLLTAMRMMGRDRIVTAEGTVSICLNPPSVLVTDASAIPSEYTRTTIDVTVDRRAILEAVKRDGVLVPGTEIVRTERIEVR